MPEVGKNSRTTKRRRLAATVGEKSAISFCRARNDEKWNSHMKDIRQAYVEKDKTLRETMELVGIEASERKWKEKLKEWGFQKNLPARDMAILVSKREKRLQEDEKETVFYLKCGVDGEVKVEVKVERLENFKKRQITHGDPPVSPNAGKFVKDLPRL
jgi:Clr5 domain